MSAVCAYRGSYGWYTQVSIAGLLIERRKASQTCTGYVTVTRWRYYALISINSITVYNHV